MEEVDSVFRSVSPDRLPRENGGLGSRLSRSRLTFLLLSTDRPIPQILRLRRDRFNFSPIKSYYT
mgnify:FL=1|jgi:hypothetical protein